MPRNRTRADALRRTIALEAARIISEQGVRDYYQAKLKAARRLGVDTDGGLPRNTEVDDALREIQGLFGGAAHRDHLRRLREAALEAMEFLADFRPRLVGPVLEGTADQHCPVSLQVFAESPEQFALHLEHQQIPFDQEERQIRLERRRQAQVPVFLFAAGDHHFEITVLPPKALRQPPLSVITGRPMNRASSHGLRELLTGDQPEALAV